MIQYEDNKIPTQTTISVEDSHDNKSYQINFEEIVTSMYDDNDEYILFTPSIHLDALSLQNKVDITDRYKLNMYIKNTFPHIFIL